MIGDAELKGPIALVRMYEFMGIIPSTQDLTPNLLGLFEEIVRETLPREKADRQVEEAKEFLSWAFEADYLPEDLSKYLDRDNRPVRPASSPLRLLSKTKR
jgi:hypothetical protein